MAGFDLGGNSPTLLVQSHLHIHFNIWWEISPTPQGQWLQTKIVFEMDSRRLPWTATTHGQPQLACLRSAAGQGGLDHHIRADHATRPDGRQVHRRRGAAAIEVRHCGSCSRRPARSAPLATNNRYLYWEKSAGGKHWATLELLDTWFQISASRGIGGTAANMLHQFPICICIYICICMWNFLNPKIQMCIGFWFGFWTSTPGDGWGCSH